MYIRQKCYFLLQCKTFYQKDPLPYPKKEMHNDLYFVIKLGISLNFIVITRFFCIYLKQIEKCENIMSCKKTIILTKITLSTRNAFQ